MPTYQVDVGGKTYEVDAPDPNTAWQWANYTHRQAARQAPAPSTERTFGEAAKDVAAGLTTGLGGIVQLPGQLYGLATGDFSKTGALGLGESISKYGEEMKSPGLKAREEARAAEVKKAEQEGQLSAFMTAFGQTVKDPALLTTFLTEQAPQLIPMILAGGGAGYLAKRGVMSAAAARNAAREAAGRVALKEEAVKQIAKESAVKAGTTAAIQTGAVMQGADVGAGAYDEIYKELRAKGMSEAQAAAETINKARAAGVAGYGLSVLANRYLPGGSALEQVLAGKKLAGSRLGTAAVTGLKEIPGENIEEIGGRIAQNIAAQQAGLERDTLSGVGETAAMATIGAAGMGGGAGLLAGRARKPEVAAPEKPPAETPAEPTAEPTEPTQPTAPRALESFFEEKKPEPQSTDEKLRAMIDEYNKREAQIKEMEARGVSLTGPERGLLLGKRKKNERLKGKINDAIAKASTQGAADVAGPDEQAGGAGTSVPAQSEPEPTATERAGTSESDGVVSARPDAGVSAEGKAGKPVAVTEPSGEALGTQAPQTQQAKTQGQQAPAAPAVTETTKSGLFVNSKKLGPNDEIYGPSEFAGASDEAWFDPETNTLYTEYSDGTSVAHYAGDKSADGVVNLKRVTTPDEVRQAVAENKTFVTIEEGSDAVKQSEVSKPKTETKPAAPAVTETTRKTKLDTDESFLDSMFGDDGLPSRGTAAATPEQEKIDAKLNAMAADYGLTRMAGESAPELAKRLKKVMAERRAAEQEFVRRTTESGEPIAAIEDKLLAQQSLIGKKPISIPAAQREMYEEMREGFNAEVEDETQRLPEFDKLTPDEKVKYFQENISRNSWDEHERAAQSLSDYIEAKRTESEEATRRATKRGIPQKASEPQRRRAQDLVRAGDSYQRERLAFSRKTGIAYELPNWGSLSSAAQRLYADINKTDTVLEQDMAFRAVKKQVQKEQEEERSRLGLEEAESRTIQEMEAAAERARESQPAGKGSILPLSVIKMLGRGDIKGVLDYLNQNGQGLKPKTVRLFGQGRTKIRDTVAQKVFRALAGALANVEGLKVNVVFDRGMVYDQLARYDAKTNTLYVGPNGLDEATILHELLHAATVKVIHQFFTDKTKLDARQIAAVEQIQTIASYAKRIMGSRFPNAFENLYEFVAYALTDLDFQNELSKAQVPGVAKATVKTGKQAEELAEIAAEAEVERELGRATEPTALFDSLWDAFTGTLAWMYKLFRPEQKQTKILLPTQTEEGLPRSRAVFPERGFSVDAAEAAIKTYNEKARKDADRLKTNKGETIERGVTNLQRAILREPGYKGNLLLEVAAAVQQIMEAPEGGIEALAGKETVSSELYAKKPKAQQKREKAPETVETVESVLKENELPQLSTVSKIRQQYTTRKAYNLLKKKFQNSRDAVKRVEDAAVRAGKVIFDGSKINSVYTSIVLSSGRAKDLFLTRVEPHAAILREAINDYAKKTGKTVEEAARDLHVIAEAMHEGERRDVKYMLNVPLSTKKTNITLPNGKTVNMAPSEYRIKVMEAVYSGELSKTDVAALRKSLDTVIAQHKDPLGFSGINAAEPGGYKSVDRDSTDYNVVKASPKVLKEALDKLYTKQTKSVVDAAMKAMQGLHKATRELDRESNYWSKPVQSVVDFYGWENYIPLKGKQHFVGKNDDMLNFDGPRLGKDYQESQNPFEGRETPSDNSLIQSMVDATRAAMRAGRKDVTLAIKNAVKDKLLYGEVVKENIPFADRQLIPDMTVKVGGNEVSLNGPNFVFHYKPDGTIDVIYLNDREQREAIKRTYQESQPLIDSLNWLTSKMGQMHTRYNVAFAPMNFVRDALTNAFMLGADMGPKVAAQYIGAIAAKVANGGMFKALNVARLYENGNFKEIERLAKKDPYIAAMYDYIQEGGKVSYLQGISSKSQQQELQRDLSSSNLKKAGAAVNKVLDIWNDMFELASRTAAYEITKSQEMAKGLDAKAASKKAAGYAKNLANFEQTGEWGRAAGAMFMFFRPAATGAVRAIEALAPAFPDKFYNVESAMADLPKNLRDDPEAVKKFKADFERQRNNARVMTLGLMGMGAAIYGMAFMMADDDDQGRNRVATDDATRWSRYARFHFTLGEKDIIFQIPWGFGLGAFAAAGAQMASIGMGNTSIKDALTNTVLIGMDSFLPLPVSRINPMEHPAAWLMDSALPSALRPFLEWTMNLDGLGREIYNNRQSRYGDAYTGGDNIPEMYKAAARMLYSATSGGIDVSPNTLYFFANNYLDGVSRLGAGAVNIGMVGTGEKEFNPKTDTVLFDSFFGAPSNIDARQFSNAEKKIESIKKRMESLKKFNPDGYADYISKNPMHPFIVDTYNSQVNQTLRDLREQANNYRRMPELSVKERTELVKSIVGAQNLVKRNILNMMDALELDY